MDNEHIVIFLSDEKTGQLLEHTFLRAAGYEVTQVKDGQVIDKLVQASMPDLIILGDVLPLNQGQEDDDTQNSRDTQEGLKFGRDLLERYPNLQIILLADEHSERQAIDTLRSGFADYIYPPLQSTNVINAVRQAILRGQRLKKWAFQESKRNTKTLERRLNDLEAFQNIGRQITASLDLDIVLTAVVDAAVELTGAEEGSLLLLDENSGELYMRAARNFQEDFVRTFRIPAKDSLPGEALRSGKPVLIHQETPQKIKTAYLVRTLMYVPMRVKDREIGVLGVDNRQDGKPFSEYHLGLVSALADYAAIAIENARLYAQSEIELKKLETFLTKIKDAVIVVDQESRLMLINQSGRDAFIVENGDIIGKRVRNLIQNQDLLEILVDNDRTHPYRSEISLDDGRILNAQVTPIPEVGLAVIMQDITYLKELDRIKSDFVSTVSHDLRSPLTAILGYVELIDRVGPINAQQKEFIRRVELSVQSITALINDLLELGRIEAGFDARKEIIPVSAIIQYTVDSLKGRIVDKSQTLELTIPDDLPQVLGNPMHMRQMLSNLVGNAIKYTPEGGKISVSARAKGDQTILQVSDNGPGIPYADQAFIFDKFYRAGNVPDGVLGTGLGLAIVKSIVENHQGRIWVESVPSAGSTFTVVLPTFDETL
jgi:two-component system phosphate regulon sensor histidine kinase PhoR